MCILLFVTVAPTLAAPSVIVPGDKECGSTKKHDYATTIITSENPELIAQPTTTVEKKRLFSLRKASKKEPGGFVYGCATPQCLPIAIGKGDLYLNSGTASAVRLSADGVELELVNGRWVI